MDAVRAELESRAAEDRFSGVVLVTRGDDVLFEGSYGFANRADGLPITPATRFATASITKMFTAAAVGALADQGALRFEDPVVGDVTVHHLLTHTSGIADYFEEEEEDDYAALWRDRPMYTMRTPADFLPMFEDLPPLRPPGGRFQYSNAGYVRLALVVEAAAGLPFPDAVAELVFEPAGMHDSFFPALDEVHPNLATGYLRPAEPGGQWRTNIYSTPVIGGGDGGAFVTTHDIGRFLSAFDAGKIVAPATRDRMLAPHRPTSEDSEDLLYGCGFWLRRHGELRCFGHGGGDPGVAGLVYRFPSIDTNVIVLSNAEDPVHEIRDLIVAQLLEERHG